MGFDTISAFEMKISGGCGELVLSRDVWRLAPRMDFCRNLHLYYSMLGHYVNNLIIMASVYTQVGDLAGATISHCLIHFCWLCTSYPHTLF
jgi:hypothetical protein